MYLSSNIPSLGEVRGKIVVFSNVSGLPGIHWRAANIQDDYDPVNLNIKEEQIAKHLDLTINNHTNNEQALLLTF
ncbi:hypothetical protein [Xenorhabdus innexi]|uniref:Uncharacterized protein n=1 Tax=Xenorhabdus innexi TaxID=290109 RepID=A0A1N6MXL0_9GAMM|nr:hypothetical protein [Xenorhabdus innexi]PHM27525.1 hypothetical protein Xinn_03970 [Xenorhabdus innexi]SIP73514.1 hypothetical protein XIS1_30005 [Xenorhabdus innexi]